MGAVAAQSYLDVELWSLPRHAVFFFFSATNLLAVRMLPLATRQGVRVHVGALTWYISFIIHHVNGVLGCKWWWPTATKGKHLRRTDAGHNHDFENSHLLRWDEIEDVQRRRMRFSMFRQQVCESGRISESGLNKQIYDAHRGSEWNNS